MIKNYIVDDTVFPLAEDYPWETIALWATDVASEPMRCSRQARS